MARGMEPLLNRTLPRPEDLCRPVVATEFVLVGRRFASWLERVPVLNGTAAPSGFIDLPNLYEPSRVEATLPLTVHGGILAWAGRSVSVSCATDRAVPSRRRTGRRSPSGAKNGCSLRRRDWNVHAPHAVSSYVNLLNPQENLYGQQCNW